MFLPILHTDPSVEGEIVYPILSETAWVTAERALEHRLEFSAVTDMEFPTEGKRYLVGRILPPLEDSVRFFDYLLTYMGGRWERHVSVWQYVMTYPPHHDVLDPLPIR